MEEIGQIEITEAGRTRNRSVSRNPKS